MFVFFFQNLLLYKAYQDQVFGKKLPKISLSHTHTPTQIIENLHHYFQCFEGILGNIPYFFEENILEKYQITSTFFENEENKNQIIELITEINQLNFSKNSPENLSPLFEKYTNNKDFEISSEKKTDKLLIDFVLKNALTQKKTKVLQIFSQNSAIFSNIYTKKKAIDEEIHFNTLQNIYLLEDNIDDFRQSFLEFSLQNIRNISYPKVVLNDFLEIDLSEKYAFLVGKNEFEQELLADFGLIFCDFSHKNTDFLEKNAKIFIEKAKKMLINEGVLTLIFSKKQLKEYEILTQNFQILYFIKEKNAEILILKNKNTETNTQKNLDKNTEKQTENRIKSLNIKNDFQKIIEKYQNIDFFIQKIFAKNQPFDDETCVLRHISTDIFLKNQKNINDLFKKSETYWQILYKNQQESKQNQPFFKPLRDFFEVKNELIFDKNYEKNQEKSAFFLFENISFEPKNIKNFKQINDILQQKILYIAHNSHPETAYISDLLDKNLSLLQNQFGDFWLMENDFLAYFLENEQDIVAFQKESQKKAYKKMIFVCDKLLQELEKNYPFAYKYVLHLQELGIHSQIFLPKNQPKPTFYTYIFPKEKINIYENIENTDFPVYFSDNFMAIYPRNEVFLQENISENTEKNDQNIYNMYKNEIKNYLQSSIFGLFLYEKLNDFFEINPLEKEQIFEKISPLKLRFIMQKAFLSAFFLDIFQEFEEENKLKKEKKEPKNTIQNNKDKQILARIGFENDKEMDKICINLYKSLDEKAQNFEELLTQIQKNHKKITATSKANLQTQAKLLEKFVLNLEIIPKPNIIFLKKLEGIRFLFSNYEIEISKEFYQKTISLYWKRIFQENFNLKKIEKRNQDKLFE